MSGAPDKIMIRNLILPAPQDVIRLDPVDRDFLTARILAEQRRRKVKNITRSQALPDPADWIEGHCITAQNVNNYKNFNDYSKASRIVLEPFQKRILRLLLTINPRTGRFPYRTVVYSAPKKSGKTTFGACFTSYFAANVEAPNSVFVLANDRKQSADRTFAFAVPTLKALGAQKNSSYRYTLPNGTLVQANTSDPESEAGGSYGLTVWDELWAYKGERARLLFDELMPIATRNISMRLITTYAGFENVSELLLSLYLKVFKTTEELELQPGARPVPGFEDLTTTNKKGETIPTCYEVPDEGIFYFNDHEQRMVWQRGEAGAALRKETQGMLTEENVYRLMENRWQVTQHRFLKPEFVDQAVRPELRHARLKPMTFAIDASEKHDNTALVGTYEKDMRYVTGFAKAWNPGGENIDLQETVMAEVLRLWRAGLILRREAVQGEKKIIEAEKLTPIDVHYDTYQMHQVAMNLRKDHKLLMLPFNQGADRLVADTFLRKQYHDYNLDIVDEPDLISHVKNAEAQAQTTTGNEDKIRIVKPTGEHSKPIDACVAQSMSVWRCSQRPRVISFPGIVQGSAKGWNVK